MPKKKPLELPEKQPPMGGLREGQRVRLIYKVLVSDGEKKSIQERVRNGKVVSIYPYIFGVRWKDSRYIEYFGSWILHSTGAERMETG
ncbi:hypothetical protein [Anaerotignum sp.]